MKLKSKTNAAAAALLKDPRFLYRVGRKIRALGMVGEARNVLIVFLVCLTMLLRRKASVLVAGPSSSGKSTVLEIPLKLIPPEAIVRRASFSPKAIAYGKESFDKKILLVIEYRGGKDAQYLIRILQSEEQLSYEYTSGRKTNVNHRVGSPVVLTTTTEDDIFEDDATRFLTIRIDETSAQNLAVLKAELGAAAEDEDADLPIEVWRQAVRRLGENYTNPFKFPAWFNFIAEQVPADRVRTRRDWKRALAVIEAVALCRSQASPSKEITFADYCVAYVLLNSALTASACVVNENELRLQKAVISLNTKLKRAATIKEVREVLGWQQNMTYKYVRQAVRSKLIRYEDGTNEKNVKRLLPVSGSGAGFLPSPKLVLQEVKELPPTAEYIDPLSGSLKKLVRE